METGEGGVLTPGGGVTTLNNNKAESPTTPTTPVTPVSQGTSPESPPLNGSHSPDTPSPMVNGGDPDSPKPDEIMLLKLLEEENKKLESDNKSLQSLSAPTHSRSASNHSVTSGHSRKGSGSSIISGNSVASSLQYEEDPNPDELWEIWGKIVNDWENKIKKKPQYVRDLVRKGVPHHFRGIVWQLLCNAHTTNAKEQYAEYLKQSSSFEKVIRRDITRTYPEHDFFKEKNGLGQESLFNVMKAYSLYDREVGYCQGSGFIVGLLLMQMPEEEAFAVLVQLMGEYRLRELYKPSMAELGVYLFQLECMIQEQLPDLYIHFQAQHFCVSMFASSWFLTLFTTVLPLPVACRIFDAFLSEGMEIVFRIGFAILQLNVDELLKLDMEGMLRYFQKTMPAKYESDPDSLMSAGYLMKYNHRKMKKLEKEYNALKSKEQEDQVELRRLRTENRLLRQRIDNLEKETATLADRLIQDQVIRAQREEEVFVLRRELATVKEQHAVGKQRLEQTEEELRTFKEQTSIVSSNVPGYESQPSQEDRIQELQEQVTHMRQRDHESTCTVKEMRDKIKELEYANRQLQQDPSAEIQSLQEELIACKLREAEANRSMQELRQRVNDLDKYWQKHVEKSNSPVDGQTAKPSKDKVKQMQEEVMNVRLREAQSISELQEMKQKVMELETQNQIANRQIKRMDEENNKLKENVESGEDRIKEVKNQVKELERNISDLESKRKEDTMMSRIKDAEHSQSAAEMRQRIAELEIENQELVTAGQLQEKGETEALENRIADLQEEIMQLKMAKRLQSISSLALNHIALDTESDYDTDDLDGQLVDTDLLKLTDSYGPDNHPLAKHKLRLQSMELDSSEGEGGFDHEGSGVRRKSTKKRKNAKMNGDKSQGSSSASRKDSVPSKDNATLSSKTEELEVTTPGGSDQSKVVAGTDDRPATTTTITEETNSHVQVNGAVSVEVGAGGTEQ